MYKLSLILSIFFHAGFSTIASANSITREEKFALTRDAFGRENPDNLLSGFFAPWPFALYLIAGTFGLLSLGSILAYTMGFCRNPKN